MNMKKNLPWIILVILLIGSAIIWNQKTNEPRDLSSNPYRIAFIRMKEGGQFWGSMRNGAREARTDTFTSVDFFSTVNALDIETQKEFVEKAISNNVDAIVITPSDSKALIDPLKKASEQGIKIIQLFNEVQDKELENTYSVLTDSKEIGVQLAEEIINKFPNKPLNILLVSRSQNISSSHYMENGIMERLKNENNINCSSLYAGSDIDLIAERVENYINNYGKINCIIALDDDTSEGVSKYFNTESSNKNIYYFATTHALSNIQNLDTGIIDELLILNSFAMGYQGVYAANEILKGNDLQEQKIDYIFVTKEQMFDEDVQRKLFVIY
jgi:ribose transport system substrate-binding protein